MTPKIARIVLVEDNPGDVFPVRKALQEGPREKGIEVELTCFADDRPFPKIHNLEELGSRCTAVEHRLAGPAKQAAPLNRYAVRFRYPGEPYSPTVEEAHDALALAECIVAEILANLPGGAGPSRM